MNKNIYFPGLNGLRFIAASLVIFHHVEQYKFWAGFSNAWGNPVIDSLGHMSVSFFFVLSGFLITYLLLAENQKKGEINLKRFYLRRILRIWPLYFLIVAISLVSFGYFSYFGFSELKASFGFSDLLCLLLFVPNLLRVINPTMIGANQLWSVGIEEQFYAFWPVLIARFSNKIFTFLIGFIILKFTLHMAILGATFFQIDAVEKLLVIYRLFPVEQMAIGGIGGALIFHQKHKMLNLFRSPVILILTTVALMFIATNPLHGIYITYVEAVFFAILLVNVVHYKALYTLFENKFFIHMGNISYGIYMWHTLVIALLITLVKVMGLTSEIWTGSIIHILAFVLTIGVSHLSYTYFEKPFLKLKDRFAFDRMVFKRKPLNT